MVFLRLFASFSQIGNNLKDGKSLRVAKRRRVV